MIRSFASKLNPCGARIDEDADEGDSQNRPQHTTIGSSNDTVDEILAVQQKLENLPGFRIRSSEIRFTTRKPLGRGGKADVVQARKLRRWYSRGQLVAVKKLRLVDTKKARNEFVHELEVMAGLSHENVVQLVGFLEDLEKGKAWIVLSWLPNGNISEFLARGGWEIPERLSLIKDTFEGIKYLHSQQPPICHGDLKSFNILVSPSCRAVITDLGSARRVSAAEEGLMRDESGQQVQGTPTTEPDSPPIRVGAAGNQLTLTGPAWSLRWAAPEVMKGTRPGLSSDVWAAGWVCWEVMTDQLPFADLNLESKITLTVIRGKVPSPRADGQLAQIIALCSLMTDCWAFDPKARPEITRCCNEVQWMPSTFPLDGHASGSKALSVDLLLQKGRMHYIQNNYEQARLLFDQALSLARSTANQTDAAAALDWLGDIYRHQSNYARAEESYVQAHESYASIGNDQGRANTLRGLGTVYRNQTKFIQAEESYTRAKEIYARIGDDVGQANTLYGLGDSYRLQSKYTEAEGAHTLAQEIFSRIGDDAGLANTLYGLGEVYYLQSKYTEAEQSYTRAQETYARIGDDAGRANALNGLGDVYCDQTKYAQAEDLYTQAQDLFARINEETGRANTLLGLGQVYDSQSKYTQAEEAYTRAYEIYVRIESDLGQANTLDGLADVYCHQSKYNQAEHSYARAQEIYGRIDNYLGQANTLLGLGDVYRNQSKYIEAEESYTRAQEIYGRIDNELGRANILLSVGHLRRDQGRNVEAAANYTEARDLYVQFGISKDAEDASRCLAVVLQDHNSPSVSGQQLVRPNNQSTNLSQ